MSINFNQLKRKEVRRVIKTEDKENAIEIYNPNNEQREYIVKLIIKSIDVDTKELKITGREMLLDLIPQLTNIHFEYDLNKEEDKQIVEDILNDPSETLLQVIEEIEDIIKEFMNHTLRNVKNLSNLSDDELDKLLNQFKDNNETPEEKRIRELEEELNKLKEVK